MNDIPEPELVTEEEENTDSEDDLFKDPDFPADDSSLYFSGIPDCEIEWKRPKKIANGSPLFLDELSRFDIIQGKLENCWLLGALVNLTERPNLFSKVVPKDQGFGEDYSGKFHFRFWQYGEWVDIVIDDRLPTFNGKLIYTHSANPNEFWSALLEKAYAKLHGSYEALDFGNACEAMEDFSGGLGESIQIKDAGLDLFEILLKAFKKESMMCCSIVSDKNVSDEDAPEHWGLIRSHEYSITNVRYVCTESLEDNIPLLRLRNPLGDNELKWNSDWSESSDLWCSIPDSEKEAIQLTSNDDGEFWMSFDDFKCHFTDLDICNLNLKPLDEDDSSSEKKKWEMSRLDGKWVPGVTAGGCTDYLGMYCYNPQYRLILEHPDEGEEICTVMIALMQKNRRALRRTGVTNLAIRIDVYPLFDELADRTKPLDYETLVQQQSNKESCQFMVFREVSCQMKLSPGKYCIVPCTMEPNEGGEFLLRIFSRNMSMRVEVMDEPVGMGEVHYEVVEHLRSDGDEDEVDEIFRNVAGDDNTEINWMQLKEILMTARNEDPENEGFSDDVYKSMIAMLDTDQSEKINFEKFQTLWNDLRTWQAAFEIHDPEEIEALSSFQLRDVLNSAGYNLSNYISETLALRYMSEQGTITLNDFIMCAIQLKKMIDENRDTLDEE